MRALLVVGGLVALAALALATPADAVVTGPCTGMINGQAIGSSRITVPENGTVGYTFTAGAPPRSWTVVLSYAGMAVWSDSDTSDSDDLSAVGAANVNDYAWLGVGVYDLTGTINLEGGGTCIGTVEIVVRGNPLTTVLGGASAVAVVAGTGGATAASIAAAKAAVAGLTP